MAEDYLTDDEQLETVKRWTVENGAWVIGGIVIGASLWFGWGYYQNHRTVRELKAAALFAQLAEAIERNEGNAARQIGAGLIKDYSSTPYADQAELALARLSFEDNQPGAAAASLTRVINNSNDADLKDVARLRLARILIDQGKPDQAIQTLAEVPPGAFAARAHDVRGDALYAKRDFSAALREYKAALSSSDARDSDAALIKLKIADLAAAPPSPAAAIPPSPAKEAKP